MQSSPAAPALVLSPHLDDAVLSAWSLIGGPGEVTVLNVFAGIPDDGPPPWWDRLAGASDRRSHMRARLDEDRAALALAGRSAVYLPLLDRHYRTGPPDADAVATAIDGAVAEASALYAPAGIGGHEDHVVVRDVVLGLSRRAGIPLALYAELPYAARFGWPAWVTGVPEDRAIVVDADWEAALGAVAVARPALSARVHRLDGEQMARKLTAMRRYRTQFPLLNQGPVGLLEHPLVLPWEVTWSLDGDGTGPVVS